MVPANIVSRNEAEAEKDRLHKQVIEDALETQFRNSEKPSAPPPTEPYLRRVRTGGMLDGKRDADGLGIHSSWFECRATRQTDLLVECAPWGGQVGCGFDRLPSVVILKLRRYPSAECSRRLL
jgi:hypothetical protein